MSEAGPGSAGVGSGVADTGVAAGARLRGVPGRLDGRRGAAAVFALALVAFALQSLAWPLARGRDWQDYLVYWREVWEHEALFPALMLWRMPLTPFVFGPLLDLGGPVLAEIGAGALFAVTVTAWVAVARAYGRNAAIATAVLLIGFPTLGRFFHQIGSDPVFACVLALVALVTVGTVARPGFGRFALLGAGVFALVLTRPAGLPFALVLVLLPLGIPGPWRGRAAWAGTSLAALAVLALAWSGYNLARYEDFTIVRGGRSALPLYRALVVDGIVDPGNGAATRELARAVEGDLLPREPYRSWGFDVDEVLHAESTWVFDDVSALADRTWGWDDDHRQLFDVGVEAVRAHPWTYLRGVGLTLAGFALVPYAGPPQQPDRTGGLLLDDGPADAVLAGSSGRRLPGRAHRLGTVYGTALVNNWALTGPRPPPYRVTGGLEPLDDAWSPIETRALLWDDPGDQRRYEALRAMVSERVRQLPSSPRLDGLAGLLALLAAVLPGLGIWLAVSGVLLVRHRPAGLWPLLVLTLAASFVIAETSLVAPPDRNYAMPFLPLAVVLTTATFSRVGLRRRGAPSAPAL